MGLLLGDFEINYLGVVIIGVILESLWGHFVVTLVLIIVGSLWDHFWGHFEVTLGSL